MRKWLLPGIILLALLLRVVSLSDYPRGFTPDEASFGYDAYNLLLTGKDQWGKSFPLVLESFGDFKPPLYAYILVPFVKIFGLNKFSVRLPNALLATITIYITYLLSGELANIVGIKGRKKELLQIISSLLLAVSSWHMMMSRGGFEANLTTLFLTLSVYFFLKGLKKEKFLIWSAIFTGINMFSYHSPKVVAPLVFIFLMFLFKGELLKIERKKIATALLVFIASIFLTAHTFSLGAGARAKDIGIFSGALETAAEDRIISINQGTNPTLARLMHNKYQVFISRFFDNYLTYYSPQYLFLNGPAEATYGMIPGRGVLYWFEIIPLLGFIIAASKFKYKKALLIPGFWALVAPIPAALASGPGYSANRSVIMLPAIYLLFAFGFLEIIELLKKNLNKNIFKLSLFVYVGFSVLIISYFLEDYFILSPQKNAKYMLYGNYEVAEWLVDNASEDMTIIIDKKLSEPHIYIAFAHKWDPYDYQSQIVKWDYKGHGVLWIDQLPVYTLGNYVFKAVHLVEYQESTNTLLVGKPEDFSDIVSPMKVFYYPNGEPSVYVVDPQTQAYANKI